jgi:hypothetical protein
MVVLPVVRLLSDILPTLIGVLLQKERHEGLVRNQLEPGKAEAGVFLWAEVFEEVGHAV